MKVTIGALLGLGAFALILWGGYALYYGAIVPAAQTIGDAGMLPVLLFSVTAGVVAFFAPCPVSVFPAYVGLFLASHVGRTEENRHERLRHALRFGSTAAAAIVLFYGATGAVLALIGTAAARTVLQAKLPIVILIALLGLLLLLDVRLPTGILDRISQFLTGKIRREGDVSTTAQSFLYGLLYAVGGAACFLPILLTIALVPILAGNYVTGALAFLGYGFGLGITLVAATILIERGRVGLLQPIIRRSALLKRFAGLLLLLAAIAMGIFYILTGM